MGHKEISEQNLVIQNEHKTFESQAWLDPDNGLYKKHTWRSNKGKTMQGFEVRIHLYFS